jgi:hypothetical protein
LIDTEPLAPGVIVKALAAPIDVESIVALKVIAEDAAERIESDAPPSPDEVAGGDPLLGLVDKWVHKGGPDGPIARFDPEAA